MHLRRLATPALLTLLVGTPATVTALSPGENEPAVGREAASPDQSRVTEARQPGTPGWSVEFRAKTNGPRTPRMADEPTDRIIRPTDTQNR